MNDDVMHSESFRNYSTFSGDTVKLDYPIEVQCLFSGDIKFLLLVQADIKVARLLDYSWFQVTMLDAMYKMELVVMNQKH